ncbi:MAG: hypothetical protein LBG97_08415 [Coriobacteriales bacterium]|jgi:hypothetical protein|nr:hypothetical protein [Coriobacteriales bacterium]
MLHLKYLLVFKKYQKLRYFFGSSILAYCGALLFLCALFILFHIDLSQFAIHTQAIFVFAFAILNGATVYGLVATYYSGTFSDYLIYLGFTKRQLHMLALLASMPAQIAGCLFVFFALAQGLPMQVRLWLTIATPVISCLICSVLGLLLPVLQRWFNSTNQRQKQQPKVHGDKRFPNRQSNMGTRKEAHQKTWVAFAKKDSILICHPKAILSFCTTFVVMLIVCIYSSLIPYFQTYIVLIYLAMVYISWSISFHFYQNEYQAYHYYHCLLRLSDRQLVMYKLPLQILMLLFMSVCSLIPVISICGMQTERIAALLVITVYASVHCFVLDWWHLRIFRKNTDFRGLHMYATQLASVIPLLAIVYVLVVYLCKPSKQLAWRPANMPNKAARKRLKKGMNGNA